MVENGFCKSDKCLFTAEDTEVHRGKLESGSGRTVPVEAVFLTQRSRERLEPGENCSSFRAERNEDPESRMKELFG